MIATRLDDLPRVQLLPVAHEYMLSAMLANQAMLPQVIVAGGSLDTLNEVAIDLWMGASPIYTHRMRRLMGIDGDGVSDIMKALQLDVGFVHQYMNVGYQLIDERHGEFWLDHCGALLDVEPHGEERVVGMCHTIEDPTFDATAYATNPRARIRPIHRPPRVPADRTPHCRWTIEIDPTNEPVGPARLTEQVGGLALASIANRGPETPGADHDAEVGDGRRDYRGAFDPRFRLRDLATDVLAVVAREFQFQTHLLVASGHIALAERFGVDVAAKLIEDAWVATGWIAGERLALALGEADDPGPDVDGVVGARRVASVLAQHPAIPPGLDRRVTVEDNRVRLELVPESAALLDAAHPGWLGLLARGRTRGVEAMAQSVDPRVRLIEDTGDVAAAGVGARVLDLVVDPSSVPAREPDEVLFMRIGALHAWAFDTSDR